ncbi:cucumisin [Setaria viridis]|uniref:cucumisin n=1 Tax=Setaria viridis TaxID=4556 RepID=UPI003B3B9133
MAPRSGSSAGFYFSLFRVYVVFTERQAAPAELSSERVASFHHDLLTGVIDDSSSAPDRVVYHYSRTLHGFAARLTDDEKNRLAGKDGVISIHEKVVYRPQTTRSWDFLGLPHRNDPTRLPFESDVIIGMVDTGIWPDSASFSDAGLPPPPAKWKGVCSRNFTSCNNKIIGARSYRDGNTTLSVLDNEGHGTHTASTAAGRAVPGASLGGLAGGTARGAVPGARIAVYKVCWEDGCSSEDILAAFDDAVADGVDVISASLGSGIPYDYAADPMAIGAFHAARSGVVVSVSAGNSGPELGTVCNVAPWTISTGAALTDRRIVTEVALGDGRSFEGSAITVFPHLGKPSLLMDPGSCDDDNLAGKRYKGAVLLCGNGDFGSSSAMAATGADGAIAYRFMDHDMDTAFSFDLPLAIVKQKEYEHIADYYNSTRHPVATIKKSVTVKDAAAPAVAQFSSRGPNMITYGVLKPDLSAPGVDILAAWSPEAPVSGSTDDKRRAKYNIISGTSMACPHVTGAAAYLKSAHPGWSHAAVLSALVTTATPMGSGEPEAEHAYGAGQVDPLRARYPGLVYDASEADYVAFLCAQGYNSSQLATVTGRSSASCSDEARGGAVGDLNYPTIAVPVLNYGVGFAAEFPRTVTNVGPADSVYRATVTTVPGVDVTVTPDELAFSAGTKKLSFKVSVSGKLLPANGTMGASAAIVWSDGRHHVRSPIYVFPHKHVM